MLHVELDLSNIHVSDYFQRKILSEWSDDFVREHGLPPIAGGASFSDYLELKVLDHIFNDGTFSAPGAVAIGLWTSALTDASTGATAGEAAYTTYARVTTGAADFSAAAAGSKTNTAAFTFPACTASSATVTFWGTATSTVISTTQTPPTIAIGGLVCTLD